MESGPRRPVLIRFFRVIRKRKWFVLFIAAAAAAAGGLIALCPPRLYSAHALILVQGPEPGRFWLHGDGGYADTQPGSRLGTEMQLVKTVSTAQRAARDLQQPGQGGYPAPAQIVPGLTVTAITPDLLRVTFRSPQQDLVVPVVNAVAQAYRDAAWERHGRELKAGEAFLLERLQRCRRQMTELERQRVAVLQRAGSADIDEEIARLNKLLLELDGARLRMGQASLQLGVQAAAGGGAAPVTAARPRLAAELRARGKHLAVVRSDVERLDEALRVQRTGYQDLWNKLMEQRYDASVRPGAAEVVEPATQPQLEDGAAVRTLVLSALAGLVFGCLLAVIAEGLDTTLQTPDDIVTYTGLDLLGVVPRLDGAGEAIVTLAAPRSPAAETYRLLRSNITFALSDAPGGALLFTSATVGEGKSIVIANLAIAFAQAGQRVLVLESDLRRPRLRQLFQRDKQKGLAEVLAGEAKPEEVVQQSGVPGVEFVACGKQPPNPADLLGSPAMSSVLQELRGRADIVLLDSPPALAVADAALLAGQVDHVLVVCEAGRTTREALAEMRRLIENARGHVLGVILNKLRVSVQEFYARYNAAPGSEGGPRPTAVPN